MVDITLAIQESCVQKISLSVQFLIKLKKRAPPLCPKKVR